MNWRAFLLAGLMLCALAGLALPLENAPATHAYMTDSGASAGAMSADVPIAAGCSVWVSDPAGTGLHVASTRQRFPGCVRSNADITIHGADHTFKRTVRYATEIKMSHSEQELEYGSIQVPPEPYPYSPDVEAITARAAARGVLFTYPDGTRLDAAMLVPGIHRIEGRGDVDLRAAIAHVTILASDRLTLSLSDATLRSYASGFVAVAPEVRISIASAEVEGVLFAEGNLDVAMLNGVILGQAVGGSVDIRGHDGTIEPRNPLTFSSEV